MRKQAYKKWSKLYENIEQLDFNSIGGTALEVGSVKVNTVNLARIAYETNSSYTYLKLLESRILLCLKVLDVIRSIISRNIEKGLLPNYSLGLIKLASQYNTIGIIGLYETLQKFNFTYKDEFGNTYYTERGIDFAKEILSLINETKNNFIADKNYSVNIEQIPKYHTGDIAA